MIFIIFFVALIVIGIVFRIVMKSHKKDYHSSWKRKLYVSMVIDSCTLIGLAGLAICLIVIFTSNIGVNEKIYEAQLDRESIVQQLECVTGNYEDVSKAVVIDKVYQWNKGVHYAKYWSQNLWSNWFWNKEYVYSLKYIDMGD